MFTVKTAKPAQSPSSVYHRLLAQRGVEKHFGNIGLEPHKLRVIFASFPLNLEFNTPAKIIISLS